MNIAEILKNCPKGTKLWSPLFGDCTLCMITCDDYPIQVKTEISVRTFTAEGKYLMYEDGECLLFPSKENRDWTKFHQHEYKPGDFVYFKTIYDWICLFRERSDGMVCTFLSYDPEKQEFYGLDSSGRNYLCSEKDIEDSRLATEQEKAEVLEALARKGYVWDAKNLKVVKKAYEFKPFDRVLVRDTDTEEWRCAIFSHITSNENYFGRYVTETSTWKRCIPYKGNEHLVGTTNDPDYSL